MAEVTSLALAVFPLFIPIMDTLKIAISISHREENLSIARTNLYVERARLGEFARILGLVSDGSSGFNLNSEQIPIAQRIMTSSIEKLIETQRLIKRHGYTSGAKSGAAKMIQGVVRWTQDEVRLSGLIKDLRSLNDSLYSLIELSRLQEQIRPMASSASSPEESLAASISRTNSFVKNIWETSVEGLNVFGETIFKSLILRRTFRQAAVRLTVWRDGFDFELSQIEIVLGTNEYLYKALVIVFSRLAYLHCKRNALLENRT